MKAVSAGLEWELSLGFRWCTKRQKNLGLAPQSHCPVRTLSQPEPWRAQGHTFSGHGLMQQVTVILGGQARWQATHKQGDSGGHSPGLSHVEPRLVYLAHRCLQEEQEMGTAGQQCQQRSSTSPLSSYSRPPSEKWVKCYRRSCQPRTSAAGWGRIWCLRRDACLEIAGEWTALMPFFYSSWLRTGSSQGVLSIPTDLSDVPESL